VTADCTYECKQEKTEKKENESEGIRIYNNEMTIQIRDKTRVKYRICKLIGSRENYQKKDLMGQGDLIGSFSRIR
jgi:hypothetical protein